MSGAPGQFRRRIKTASLIVLVVGLALVTPWAWRLAGGDDTALIDLERAERQLRAAAGLPMSGTPALDRLPQRLAEQGLAAGAPIFIRIFKREFELELWMKRGDAFQPFATYPICRWSGTLGPKLAEGDRQAPEGFYTVDKNALNPNSRYYRSFNLGYPNAYDTSLGRTGSLIMVHGGCASIGCFAMTDAQMDEIWRLVTAALDGGQKRFQVQVFPFRMTPENLKKFEVSPSLAFWRMLKRGNDLFEARLAPPRVMACAGRYDFEPANPDSAGDAVIEDRCTSASPKNS
ncbi:MAG: L,D-transpeptidase family protein [Hyphomicrobium sp.]